MADENALVIERAKRAMLQNYRQQPIAIDRGSGVWVWDVEGKRYLDFLGGIATCALGHCHPEVVQAVKEQADRLWHVSNVFYTLPHVELAEALARVSGLERVFLCNSGAEANEAMIKLARKAQKDRGQADRFEVICFQNSFHGRTLATVAATGQEKYQKGFEPLPEGFCHVPYGDLAVVERAVGKRTAAVLVEPILGEGGVRVPPEGFLRGLRELCTQRGLLLLVDEVQTGMGRTGKFFGFQHEEVRPDAVSMAKALGNGVPIGAMLCREELGGVLGPGSHGSTFGGNLLAVAAARVAVSRIAAPEFLERVRRLGERFMAGAQAIWRRCPERVLGVRGRGLLVGIEVGDAAAVVSRCRDEGLLVNLAGERTVRFAPPFVVTEAEIEVGLGLFERALTRG